MSILLTSTLVGTIFAIPGALSAYFWSRWMTKGKNFPPAKEIEVNSQIIHDKLPSAFLSFLPIVVPLLLITFRSLFSLIDKGGQSLISKILYFPGEPIFALSIGVVLAMFLIKEKTIASMNFVFSEAIEKAGPILIVTAAGGRLFAMLAMGAGSMIVSHANDSYFWVISNFSDIDPGTTLKVYSSSTFIMGVVVFICVWITSLIIL